MARENAFTVHVGCVFSFLSPSCSLIHGVSFCCLDTSRQAEAEQKMLLLLLHRLSRSSIANRTMFVSRPKFMCDPFKVWRDKSFSISCCCCCCWRGAVNNQTTIRPLKAAMPRRKWDGKWPRVVHIIRRNSSPKRPTEAKIKECRHLIVCYQNSFFFFLTTRPKGEQQPASSAMP